MSTRFMTLSQFQSSSHRLRYFALIRLVVLVFSVTAMSAGESRAESFRPGVPWLDSTRAHINAHGGGILKVGNVYYWFGEKRDSSHSQGVAVYSSADLYNWRNEGLALTVDTTNQGSDIADGCIIERPKVLFNKRTRKYVMWFHLELKGQRYKAARVAVAVSDSVTGPYRFIKSFRPNGNMSRDMTVFQDDNSRAYLIYSSRDNHDMRVAQLTDDYQGVTTHDAMIFSETREAPAIFKSNGTYYLITSGCTGWAANQARLHTAKSIFGPWTNEGNPMRGPGSERTFDAQSTFILSAPRLKNRFIFMADRWNPKDIGSSTHIWLPIRFENNKPEIGWIDSWNLSTFSRPQEPSK